MDKGQKSENEFICFNGNGSKPFYTHKNIIKIRINEKNIYNNPYPIRLYDGYGADTEIYFQLNDKP